ncbi:XRE family transcriptional regulator [Mesorhizobium sp. M5C.F.Ca.IN.020.29.1.1]|uniref:helix-turn-helix domain-containing protein n=1 Tax=Mesorhizobium sp. M5C.F.Ca.IN.020.29.1.1 TaxID=2496770 RepID=UPI000FCC30E2|nr:helix-turn-helix transcriptional regulator [Mesorhizobium sp. M5C.F.Ca.IN.020.29.1.1]RUV48752.1 XRE family transcriptional regulator [Mesorhizobium sp. M5C.F.Ca.IN.020.29.1.1]
MDVRNHVGRNFARLRREKSLTQEEVEGLPGSVNGNPVTSSLERGRRNPTMITLSELAQELDVRHVELVKPDDAA